VIGPTTNSDVPTSSSSLRGSSANGASTPPEPPPSAKIGPEPEYDEIPTTPTQRNSSKPPAGATTAKPGQTPALQGPNTGASTTGRMDPLDARRISATASKDDRRNLLVDRLQPFVAGTSGRELFYPNKADRPWRYIVLHHSASASGSYDQIDREHRKLLGYDGCGYHFVIGNGAGSADGQIEVAQRWNNQKQGAHCRNARSQDMDEYGIGICLVGDLDQHPPTPRQVAATQALVGYLSQRYRIEPGHIATHSHVASTQTVCPGKFFPSQLVKPSTKEAAHDGDLRATWHDERLLTMTR
jgi:N-acetylmuramoyl-L-alanine amidase